MNRILKNDGTLLIVTERNLENRAKYFNSSYWEIKEQVIYKKTLPEEENEITMEYLKNEDQELEESKFCQILSQQMTKVDLKPFRFNKFYYVLICTKNSMLVQNERNNHGEADVAKS